MKKSAKPACTALNVCFSGFASTGEYETAVHNLMASTRHLRRGEMGCEVEVGNNFDGRQISIDGPSALVSEVLEAVYAAGFVVTKLLPHRSAMAIAA